MLKRAVRGADRFSSISSRRRIGVFESLEPRTLLYATTGGAWPQPDLVTVSFMPDGTDLGGVSSVLFQTMNSRWATATWQKEMLKGLQNWAVVSNLNFSTVADDGAPFGSAGLSGSDNNVQGDSNFGDIRMGGFDLGSYIGVSLLPPPINGDTTAGDFFLNTAATWKIGSTYDLLTVSAHEAGHSLGLGHSDVSSAGMYASYNGVKTNLTSDDIAGIQSIYGARQHDTFDAASSNSSRSTATVITSHIDSNKQVSLTGLDITTASDVDYFKITVPSGAAGTMTVRMQTEGLSLLAPKLELYNSGGSKLATATGTSHGTVQLSRSISPGQVYYIKTDGVDSTVFGIGRYALQINMGAAVQAPAQGSSTATPSTAPGGTSANANGCAPGILGSVECGLGSGIPILDDLIAEGKAIGEWMHSSHDSGDSHDSGLVVHGGDSHSRLDADDVGERELDDRAGRPGGRGAKHHVDHSHGSGHGVSRHASGGSVAGHKVAAYLFDAVADAGLADVVLPGGDFLSDLARS